jgi:hypothetical protein
MHFALHALHVMSVSDTCIFALDHAKQGRNEPSEAAQVEDVNTEQEQGKPRCI